MSAARRIARGLGAVALAAALLALLLAALASWLVATEPGTRAAAALAARALSERLAIGGVEGALARGLVLRGLRYRDPGAGVDVAVDELALQLEPAALWQATLRLRDVRVAGLRVTLSEPTEPQPDEPFSLEPPIDVVVDRLTLRDATLSRDGASPVTVASAALEGAWTQRDGLQVERLDAIGPQGELHVAGGVSATAPYTGSGRGRFRWSDGTRQWAGALDGRAGAAGIELEARLREPLAATLTLRLAQAAAAAWTYRLQVPAFDPSATLLPGSSLTQLAADLAGDGDTRRGRTAGRLALNGVPLDIDALAFVRDGTRFDIDGRLRFGGGTLAAKGVVETGAGPPSARLALDWRGVTIPRELAGQRLATAGKADFDGSLERFGATGAFQVGPPRRLADVRVALRGTPQAIEFERLDVVQAPGRLAAKGRLELEPAIAWRFSADASRFDPGALFADWPGQLDFALASDGRVEAGEPVGRLRIDQLRGRLRRREVSGEADLELRRGLDLRGRADLRSGRSRIQVVGARAGTLTSEARIEVATLDDWWPGATGSLHGTVAARGRWPELDVDGTLAGSGLRVGDVSADQFQLELRASRPLDPSGRAALGIEGLAAAGFTFTEVDATLDGSRARHRIALRAAGPDLSLEAAATGRLDGSAWSGRVERLGLDVPTVADLALENPFDLAYSESQLRMSQACLVQGRIRACLEGDARDDGRLLAKYALTDVPLALLSRLLLADLPVLVTGRLQGEGDFARDAGGGLRGTAALRVPRGRITPRESPREAVREGQVLPFADLELEARFEGDVAQGRASARVAEAGELRAGVTVRGVGAAVSPLEGDLALDLATLEPFEMLLPGIAGLKGESRLRATIGGTLDAPEIRGALTARDLAADVPGLGLRLRDGELSAVAAEGRRVDLSGAVGSGKGTLRFSGEASLDGTARLRIEGEDVLAADLPGARVEISPRLDFERGPERMTLTGEASVPRATVNLARLPRGGVQGASPDVVVVDDVEAALEAAQALPLFATVTLRLGDAVELAGFGLEAKLAGELVVRERPGEPTTGSGELRATGTYQAYGQGLTIREGQLRFAGTPLDDPRLNIVAVRKVDEVAPIPDSDAVVAGLRVTGSGKRPVLTVFSEPPTSEANALSWLVAGKPLEEVREGEGEMLQSAARSLGTAAGGLLARNIGQRMGVDELDVKDSKALGGAALTIGQYLSPRLYLSYGIGLFEPGQVMTLRYRISGSLSVEAETAPEDSRAGLQYRIER